MSTPEKPERPDQFKPMQLDDIAEDGLLKMLLERKARKLRATHSTWSFGIWERRPSIWAPGFAFTLKDGAWVEANSSEVGMEARSSTKEAVEAEFGPLPATPPFPLKEIQAALEEVERRSETGK